MFSFSKYLPPEEGINSKELLHDKRKFTFIINYKGKNSKFTMEKLKDIILFSNQLTKSIIRHTNHEYINIKQI